MPVRTKARLDSPQGTRHAYRAEEKTSRRDSEQPNTPNTPRKQEEKQSTPRKGGERRTPRSLGKVPQIEMH